METVNTTQHNKEQTKMWEQRLEWSRDKLDLAFNNVKPKDWYFVLDEVRFRTELGCEVVRTNK